MMRNAYRYLTVLFLLLAVCLAPATGWAQEITIGDRPIAVGGFDYQSMARGIHMYTCRDDKCVPGSKVSYRIYAPTDNPDFEQFKTAHKMVLSRLKAMTPEGTVVTASKPERTQDELFTTFEITREMVSPNGSKMVTNSKTLAGKRFTVEVISSSENEKAAKANGALFMLPLMLLNASEEKSPE